MLKTTDKPFTLAGLLCTLDFHTDITDDQNSLIEVEEALVKDMMASCNDKSSFLCQKEFLDNWRFKKLKTEYASVDEYLEYYFPLFIVETKQSIYRAREIGMTSDCGIKVNVIKVKFATNDILNVYIDRKSTPYEFNHGDLVLLYCDGPQEGHFSLMKTYKDTIDKPLHDQDKKISLFRLIKDIEERDDVSTVKSYGLAPSPLDDTPHHCLGIVESMNSNLYTVQVVVRDSNVDLNQLLKRQFNDPETKERYEREIIFRWNRYKYRSHWLAARLSSNRTEWNIAYVTSTATIKRELKALFTINRVPLKKFILKHQDMSNIPVYKMPDELVNNLYQKYNPSQRRAIESCLKTKGITCIQGPPGTGKTSTIIAIVSVLLAVDEIIEPNVYVKTDKAVDTDVNDDSFVLMRSPWLVGNRTWLDEREFYTKELVSGSSCSTTDSDSTYYSYSNPFSVRKKRKILICAPSNAAVDEFVRRVVLDPKYGGGVYSPEGKLYTPDILRLGSNCHNELHQWTLLDVTSSKTKRNLICGAKIICCTLSIAGSKQLTLCGEDFDVAIIDESTQGTELSTLIPLNLNIKSLILVGDPKQLPATVFSKIAIDCDYNVSLFQRFEKMKHKLNLLSMQYRMHPTISRFPSLEFYEGKVTDASDIISKIRLPFEHFYEIPLFKPLVFIDLMSQETADSHKLSNLAEASICCDLLLILDKVLSVNQSLYERWMNRIAIISPYAQQVKELTSQAQNVFGLSKDEALPIDINTVDGFQGREKDFIIFSAVRSQFITDDENPLVQKSNLKYSIGFLSDKRRLNVALTRARQNIWIVGNLNYLAKNPLWARLTKHCINQNCVISLSKTYLKKTKPLVSYFVDQINNDSNIKQLIEKNCPQLIQELNQLHSK